MGKVEATEVYPSIISEARPIRPANLGNIVEPVWRLVLRLALPAGTIDRQARFAFLAFETGVIIHVVLGGTFFGRRQRQEGGVPGHRFDHHLKILFHIVLGMQDAPQIQ